jgi:hypothetical protein
MRTPISQATVAGSLFATLSLLACSGSAVPLPQTGSSPLQSVSSSRAPTPQRSAASSTSTEPRETAADSEDPEEANDPATLHPLLGKSDRPTFSKGTVSERECWRDVALTGEARQDFASLVEHCGKPTGSIEYAKPSVGRLDHLRDKRDTFIVFLRAGLCYRFFGVGDATIQNLDILIERNGALQAEDKTRGPVAIINTDQAWCMDSDAEYRFLVQVGAEGHGQYVFGVWARPKT